MKADSMPGYAFTRLMWRPMGLIILPLLLCALVMPTFGLPDGPGDLFGAVAARVANQQIRFALWSMALFVPAVSGFLFGMLTHEAMHAGVSWMIPGYRSRLLVPANLIGVPFILVTVVATGRAVSWTAAVAALGVGLLGFSMGWRLSDRTIAQRLKDTAFLAFVAIALRPAVLDNLIRWQPLLIGLITGAVGVAVWLPEISAQTSRDLVVLPQAIRGARMSDRHALRFGRFLSPRTIVGRVYAGIYESPGQAGAHFRSLMYQFLFLAVLSSLVSSTGMIATLPILLSMLVGTQLKDTFPYPMSRRERADTFFAASLFDAVVTAGMSVVVVLLLSTLGQWRDLSHPAYYLTILLFLFLLFPIGQLTQLSQSLTPTRKKSVPRPTMILALVIVLSWLGMAQLAAYTFEQVVRSAPLLSAAFVFLAGFVLIQSLYLTGLRWYFARRDFQ